MGAINLTELFSTKVFKIPDYQRGYAWIEKQLIELWEDLDEIPSKNNKLKKHYTGTIYLEETNPNETEKWLSGYKFYNVVDGQQRLTTISILLFELLEATKTGYSETKKEDLLKIFLYKINLTGESKIYKFSYIPTDNNYNFLLHSIFEDEKVLKQEKENSYTKNLEEAKKFFKAKIEELTNEEKEILFKKITTSLQFDIRIIEKDLDVQAVFETMNNRGKTLSTLEKLKNRLIYLSEKLEENPNEDKKNLRNTINESWGKIYTSLGKNHEHILDEDDFLSAHLSLYRKPKESFFSEKGAEEKVFQMFCNRPEKYNLGETGTEKEPPISFKKIEDYIVKLSEFAPIWYEIHNSTTQLIKKILVQNNHKDIKIFLCSSVLNKMDNENNENNKTFLNLEKILFRNRVPGIWITDERVTGTWARSIYNKEDDILQKIIQEQNKLLDTDIIASNIVQSFKNLFTYDYEKGKKGFYRWHNLKYFLFEYEKFLKDESRETDNKINIEDYGETTIEHIIPTRLINWKEEVQFLEIIKDSDKKKQTRNVLLNTLGNLTILKGGKNSSLGNSGWTDKKERFSTGSYNEIEISKFDSWTKNEIVERGTKMVKFLETKIKGLSFKDDEIKELLFNNEDTIKLIYNENQ